MASKDTWEVNRWLCTFKDPSREFGFLEFRRDRLWRNCRNFGLVNAFLLAAYSAILAMKLRTGAGVFTEDSPLIFGIIRLAVMGFACLTSCMLCGVGFLGSRQKIGARGMEVAIIATGMVYAAGAIAQSNWHIVRAVGESEEFVVGLGYVDMSVLLVMHLVIVNIHSTSVRIHVLLSIDVFMTCAYPLATLIYGHPLGAFPFGQTAVLFGLIGTAGLHRRSTELDQRALFQRMIIETQLRCEAEFRMESTPAHPGDVVSIDAKSTGAQDAGSAPACSIPDSTITGDVFRKALVSSEPTTMGLNQVRELGRKEHWIVDEKDLHVLKDQILGSGSFGIVIPATYLGTLVVLKVPTSAQAGFSHSELHWLAHELRIFRRLRHPNIVAFYGACITTDRPELSLVMEHIAGVEVDAYLESEKVDKLRRCDLLYDVVCALCYLHGQSPSVVHGDIKASNVLVQHTSSGTPVAKLIDFGLSRVLGHRPLPIGGTRSWMAPEIRLGEAITPAPSADVFSFGCLMFLVMTSSRVAAAHTEEVVRQAFKNNLSLALQWPRTIDSDLEPMRELSTQCQAVRPESRPTMSAVQDSIMECMLVMAQTASSTAGARRILKQEKRQHLPLSKGIQAARQRLAEQSAEGADGGWNVRPQRIGASPADAERPGSANDGQGGGEEGSNDSWLLRRFGQFDAGEACGGDDGEPAPASTPRGAPSGGDKASL